MLSIINECGWLSKIKLLKRLAKLSIISNKTIIHNNTKCIKNIINLISSGLNIPKFSTYLFMAINQLHLCSNTSTTKF